MTMTDKRDVILKIMNDMNLFLRSILNYTSLGESVTIRSLRQFSSVKLEVGIWSLVTFCKQKCVSILLSKYPIKHIVFEKVNV